MSAASCAWRSSISLATLSVFLFVGATGQPGRSAPPARAEPVAWYEKDSRLNRRRVTLPLRVGIPVGVAVRRLAETTGMPMACEPGLRGLPLAILVKGEVEVPELMHTLALAASARWVKLRGGCALCRMPELVDLSTRSDAELEAMRGANVRNLLDSLTPDQRRRLEAGGIVPYAEFTPGQKATVRSAAALSLLESPDAYRPDGLSGQGVFLRLSQPPNETQRTLHLLAPGYFLDPWLIMCPDYPGGE